MKLIVGFAPKVTISPFPLTCTVTGAEGIFTICCIIMGTPAFTKVILGPVATPFIKNWSPPSKLAAAVCATK